MAATQIISKKRKFVADGIFHAELNEFFQRHLCENGYSGCEVSVAQKVTEIVLHATSTHDVVGTDGRRIRELTALLRQRFGFAPDALRLLVAQVPKRGLCAIAQAEALKFKLLQGLAVRRAAYSVLRQVMNSGAKGCEVIISGKLRAARAKSMKFCDGFMIHSGQPAQYYIVRAVRHVMLRQGVLGIKIKIMLDHDPKGLIGPSISLPDTVVIHEPKDEAPITAPVTEIAYTAAATGIANPAAGAPAAPAVGVMAGGPHY